MSKYKIPVYKVSLGEQEKKYVLHCLDTSWISSKGEFIPTFEANFAKFLNVAGSVSVCNGTVALHLALYTLGIGRGDEVIVPTLTYVASVNAIAYVGATATFVDSESEFWNVDVSKIREKITPKTKAILAVHLYGAACNMHELREICNQYGLYLIEDVAEALGTQYFGEYAGTFGDISTFSFFGNKTLTTGEGGMVVSNDKSLIARAAYLRSQAVSSTREYWHDETGFNFRMTNICAAIGLAQLERLEDTLKKKREIARWYRDALTGYNVEFQAESTNSVHSYWMVSVLLSNRTDRDDARKKLGDLGIETRPVFNPVHLMPMFRTSENFAVAEDISNRGINLPSYPDITRTEVEYICDSLKNFLEDEL